MPRPIKNNSNFEVTRTITTNGKSTNAHMATLAAVTDHYEIGFTISGDRHVYSPIGEWDMHSGYVGTSPLNLLHQSFSTSDEIYDGILIKYSFRIADKIKKDLSPSVFNKFYQERFHILSFPDQKYILQLFEQMHTEYNINSIYTDIKLLNLLELIIVYCIEHQLNNHLNNTTSYTYQNMQISNAMRYVESHYAENLQLEHICKKFGFSPSHFSRLFKKSTGDTFTSYLAKVRMEHAVCLLMTTNFSIEKIAYDCGFNSLSYFSSAFKKYFLVSPQKYRIRKSYSNSK